MEASGPAEQRRRALEAECGRIAAVLAAAGVLRVILYGSLAAGTVSPASDLDLLVVVPEDGLSVPRRLGRLYALARPQLPCDILAYTAAELAALAPVSDLLADALRSGRTVYVRSESVGL